MYSHSRGDEIFFPGQYVSMYRIHEPFGLSWNMEESYSARPFFVLFTEKERYVSLLLEGKRKEKKGTRLAQSMCLMNDSHD